MSGFDLVSRFFGLVLALAVTELLKSLARLWRIKHGVEGSDGPQIRVGWLVPALTVFMMLDQITFWFNFTLLGPHLPANLLGLSGMLCVIGTYFGLSTFVVPADVKQWPDFDAYYMKIRTTVIGGLLAVNFVLIAYMRGFMAVTGIDPVPEPDGTGEISSILNYMTIIILIALLFARGRRANLVLLVAVIITTLGADLPF